MAFCFHLNPSSTLHGPKTGHTDTLTSKEKRSAPLMHMLLAPVAAKQVNHGGREEARTSLYSVAVTSLRILNTVRQQGSDIGLEKNQVINIPDTISCR